MEVYPVQKGQGSKRDSKKRKVSGSHFPNFLFVLFLFYEFEKST